jgi:hypothetical protein
MSQKKYRVTLTEDEKKVLHEIINKGKHGAKKRKRAQALLLANEGYTDKIIAGQVGMHRRGIEEPRLIALVCGPVPEGYVRWTLQLLEDTWVTLEHTDTKRVSRETIRQILKNPPLTLAESGVVYSSESERGVCSRYGGCS